MDKFQTNLRGGHGQALWVMHCTGNFCHQHNLYLSRFYPDFVQTHFIQISSRFYLDKFQIQNMDKRTWTGILSNALHRKFFVINIIMTYCALAAHLCFMQTIVLSPYMTTFMALATNYGPRTVSANYLAKSGREDSSKR